MNEIVFAYMAHLFRNLKIYMYVYIMQKTLGA